MKVIHARNVHQALPEALFQLREEGAYRESRNGPVRVFQEPVTTVYARPMERVMFWEARDCNPFFHLFESLWMLGGRNDVASVAHYVERMKTFSDDGTTLHGAYGFRWREHFEVDQLAMIISALRRDPTDRRQVLSMWDANVDLGRAGKDLPCNLQCGFMITEAREDDAQIAATETDHRMTDREREEFVEKWLDDNRELDMIVTNRSNDIVWGAYGANAVHFSYLHEYLARCIGVKVGKYRQMSWNFHGYESTMAQVVELSDFAADPSTPAGLRWKGLCPYADNRVEPYPLMSTSEISWNADLELFLGAAPHAANPRTMYADPFFCDVAEPMRRAHEVYKTNIGRVRYEATLDALTDVVATDWRLAAEEWVQRRFARWEQANDDGAQRG